MIDRAYVQRMARYNRWQNENLYGVADSLSDDERRLERGAWFGSIHKTLSHILWGDRTWMSRFTDLPPPTVGIPESVSLYPDWENLKSERKGFDQTMIDWADKVDDAWLAADQTLLFRRHQARLDAAALDAGHPYVQSPDPSPRPGAFHADPGRRPAGRYRPAVHAGLKS